MHEQSNGAIPRVDFSHDVLAFQAERLFVLRDTMSGWTDLGLRVESSTLSRGKEGLLAGLRRSELRTCGLLADIFGGKFVEAMVGCNGLQAEQSGAAGAESSPSTGE
jgi:hypothetical protein